MATAARATLSAPEPPELHTGDRMSREEFHRIYEQMPEKFKAELVNGTVHIPAFVKAGDEELHNGDHMTQEEFHRLYEKTAPGVKVELIGGEVFVASPLKRRHGSCHLFLGPIFATYEARTLGVEAADNTTVILGSGAEVQPDLYLRILPDFGGQSKTTEDDYIAGPPELINEISLSSRAIDLHAKLEDYRRYGVLEYVVVCLKERQIRWFLLQQGQELTADADGVLRIRVFPGLWIHQEALFARDYQRLMTVLEQGLATPEQAAFVSRLAAAGSKTSGQS